MNRRAGSARPSVPDGALPADIPRIEAFDEAEYRVRLSRVRATMRERQLDALLVLDASNVFYLSGAASQGAGHVQCLVVQHDDDPVLVTWNFERGAALLTAWVTTIVTYGWFEEPLVRLADTIRELGLAEGRLGIDLRARELSAARFAALSAELPSAQFEDGHGVIEGWRLRKSPAEISHIRAAAAITDLAVEAAYAVVAPGIRDTDVAAAITQATYRAGSETVCWGPIVASGYGAGLMHTSFHGRVLEAGDTVFLELSGQVHRYVAPVMRTVMLGDPPREVVAIRDAGMAALEAVLGTARPGARAADVARAAAIELKPVIDDVAFHELYGYSVGIGFPPSWYETLGYELKVDNERELEPGMVFHIPLSLRKYANLGVCQSQTIVVTTDGAESITRSPAELFVRRT